MKHVERKQQNKPVQRKKKKKANNNNGLGNGFSFLHNLRVNSVDLLMFTASVFYSF